MTVDPAYRIDIENRSQFYQLDTKDRALVAIVAPLVAPRFRDAFAKHLEIIRRIPHYTATLDKFLQPLAIAEGAHFSKVVECRFDDAYVATLLDATEAEAQSGFGIGVRLGVAPVAAQLLWEALAPHFGFSRTANARAARILNTLLIFDIANGAAL